MEAKVAKAVSKASRAKNLGKRVKKKQQVNIQNNKTMAHLKNDLGVDGEMNEARSHVINPAFPRDASDTAWEQYKHVLCFLQ